MIAWETKKVRRGNAANFMSGLCGYRFGHLDAVRLPMGAPRAFDLPGTNELPPGIKVLPLARRLYGASAVPPGAGPRRGGY